MRAKAAVVAISGIGILNRFGTSPTDLSENVTDVRRSVDAGKWFDAEHYLGTHGHKHLTPACCYGLAATKLALNDAGVLENVSRADRYGVLIGTNFGNYHAIAEIDATIRRQSARGIRPMAAPNFSINVASSNISIKYGFKAFNITLTNPIVAGIEAVIAGARAIANSRAEAVVVGAIEDHAPDRLCAELGIDKSEAGAGILLLEDLDAMQARDRRPYAIVRCGQSFSMGWSPNDPESDKRLSQLLSKALEKLGLSTEKKIHYCSVTYPTPFNTRVQQLLEDGVGLQYVLERAMPLGTGGHFMSVSPVYAIAHLAAKYGEGLIVAASPLGQVSLLVINKPTFVS